MNNHPNLANAPIVEGLIDFRVERSAIVSMEALRTVCDNLAEQFPSRQERHVWTGEIQLHPATDTANILGGGTPDGFLLRSADEKWVAQFRLDGFTVSRLSPYTSWAELKAKAAELWNIYKDVAKPNKVTRVATRFINRMTLPPQEDFSETFRTIFTISSALPQSVSGFLLRLAIPYEQDGVMAIVTESLEGSLDCIFDVDVFAHRPDGYEESDLWQQIERLREIKNDLFFDSLTPKAIDRLK